MPDIQMIASIMLQHSMSYKRIVKVYEFLLVLALGFGVRSKSLYCLVYVWVLLWYLIYIHLMNFGLQDCPYEPSLIWV